MRAVLFSIVILLLACYNQQPIKEQAKPQPARVVHKAKTQAELFGWCWKGITYKTYDLLIDKEQIAYQPGGHIRKIKWISDTTFTTINYHDKPGEDHHEEQVKKRDTLLFYGADDWIDVQIISKQKFMDESIDVFYAQKYSRHEKR
jgi:hypothetical protein